MAYATVTLFAPFLWCSVCVFTSVCLSPLCFPSQFTFKYQIWDGVSRKPVKTHKSKSRDKNGSWIHAICFVVKTIRDEHCSLTCYIYIYFFFNIGKFSSRGSHFNCVYQPPASLLTNEPFTFFSLQLLATPGCVIYISIPARWRPIVLNCWANCSISWLQIEFAHDSVWCKHPAVTFPN